ncbi:Lrp/AsnC family transcriptional regulator [Mycobacterium sp. AZCC_0083]|uniref:Lrp/AsnC family transcriptional regulator n=1 Tax=Mycobacterium sp. AZCC_0083 TaxID=2735882 RepID=UPI00160AA9D0|nr:Lrp/AsnC family transcriptional regulator [Mycobacterium sp. AZCC_0083]MBB5166436.1 DNA-binding Lrp family transcriptional regulator [Mycobacterium sp. AZCC_0083]
MDELDLALLDGLHVNPRVSFDELGRVLGVSGVTAARRWRRLVGAGRAWVSSAIGPALPLAGALIEADCDPGQAQAVAEEWAAVPQAASVHITTGRYNVYGLIVAADESMLARLVVDVLPSVVGVRAVQTATMFRMFSGTYWRLGAISAHQAADVSPPAVGPVRHVFDDFDRQLYLVLQQDGRLSYREVALRLGCTELAARRRLQVLTRSGLMRFRTDFARAEAGWPTNVVLVLGLPAATAAAEVGRVLVTWHEARVCAAIIGGAGQLFVTLQVHELGAVDGVVARLRHTFPGVTVLNSRAVLRPVKSFGRLLDGDGHARDVVPVNPWSDTQMTKAIV